MSIRLWCYTGCGQLIGCEQGTNDKITKEETAIKDAIKKLDIEIIAPSSGSDKETWDKVFNLAGTRREISNTKSSDEQVFVNTERKFNDLDKALRSPKKILWAVRGGYGLKR